MADEITTPAPAAAPFSFKDIKVRRPTVNGAPAEVVKVQPPAGSLGPAVEAPPAETAAEDPPKDPLEGKYSKEFKALHREKKKLREREEKLKANEAKVKEYDEFVALRDRDKLEAARRLGFTVKELNELAIKRPSDPRVLELERKLSELETARLKDQEEAKKAKIQSLQSEIKADVHSYIEENREKYKHIAAWDAADEVYKTVLDFQEIYGRDPSQDDLAKVAEKVDQALRAKHEAANKRLGLTAGSKEAQAAPGPRSLSNIRAAPEADASPRNESRDQRIKRLAAEYKALAS